MEHLSSRGGIEMAVIIITTRPFFNDLLKSGSKLLDKIQKGCHRVGISKSIVKAYEDAYKKHRCISIFPARRMDEVLGKLEREKKLTEIAPSGVKAKTKRVKIKGSMMKKHKKFVELSIALNANYLITEASAHFSISDELKRKYNIEVVRPEEWYEE